MTVRHYIPRIASATQGETEALERQMNFFRKPEIEPLDKAIAKLHEIKIVKAL